MKWQGRRQSRNVRDRRGVAGVAGGVGGVGALLLLAVGYFLGVDVTPFLQGGDQAQEARPLSAQEKAAGEFAAVTLADTEEIWADVFARQLGAEYRPATLVLFSQQVTSACGGATSATGPFYCPADQTIYLDTDFFVTLERQLGAGGDFAFAYVIAHEVGHHVQNLVGILSQTQELRARLPQVEVNQVSVRTELQADCFAGLWARHAAEKLGTLERGDIEEAMNAAARIGDDALQGRGGAVRPETFTHGSSAQRQDWFARGYMEGDIRACDSFS